MQATPTPAETICNALVRPALTSLAVDGDEAVAQPTLQHTLDSGALAILLPEGGLPLGAQPPDRVAAEDPFTGDTLDSAPPDIGPTVGHPARGPRTRMPTGLLEVTDYLVLGSDKPVRSVSWLAGYLERMPIACQRRLAVEIADTRPHEGLLDIGHGADLVLLWPTSAVLADTHGIELVDPTDLMNARPDPFSLMEDVWLTHLEQAHGDILAHLSRRLPPELRGNRVRPLAIDRFGITLRVSEVLADDAGTTDVRMPFGREVHDPIELGRAVRALARCPHPVEVSTVR